MKEPIYIAKRHRAFILALLSLMLLLACSLLPRQEAPEQANAFATRTPFPTFTATAPVEQYIPPPPTMTPIPPSPTPPPAPVEQAAPPEQPPTPEPTATDTPPPPTQPPPPPAAEEPAPPAEPPPPAEPVAGAHGVIGKISFRDGRNTYGVGEQVFVRIEVTNTGSGLLPFGILGLVPSTGSFQTSWSNDAFESGKPFTHEDGLAFPVAGTHKMWLSICFSSLEECQGPNGDWERFEPGLDVIVQ